MEIVSTPYPKQSNITEKDYLKNKSDKNIKDVNKKNKFIFKSTPSKNNNDDKNNQIEYNCNCIGKYSYKNTEAITIINNNTNENNEINTYFTTYGKINDKNEITNSKTNNSKKQ